MPDDPTATDRPESEEEKPAESSAQAALSFDETGHDHALCIADALTKAERLCAGRGVRLTELRRRVLEMVWSSHTPVGAYELLERLARERSGVAPPTVYRALEFLRAEGLVHRIESLNAFVGCPLAEVSHSGQFLICRDCGAAAEIDDGAIGQAIAAQAAAWDFLVEQATVEVRGLCPACRTS